VGDGLKVKSSVSRAVLSKRDCAHAVAASASASFAASSTFSSTFAFFSGVPSTGASSSLCFSTFSGESFFSSASAAAYHQKCSLNVLSLRLLTSRKKKKEKKTSKILSSPTSLASGFSLTGDASTSFFTSSATTSACSVL
ncbi:unnamed protein product, partial [Ixodes persulcatus]